MLLHVSMHMAIGIGIPSRDGNVARLLILLQVNVMGLWVMLHVLGIKRRNGMAM